MEIENDPNKFLKGKNRLDLVEPIIIKSLGEILTYGADKYSANSWKKVKNPKDIYYAALMRHILAWREREDNDKDTAFHHLKCAAANIMFLLFFEKNDKSNSA